MAIKVDPTFQSGRVSLRPLEYVDGSTVFGHYRVTCISGATLLLTANDPILSYRWTSTVANAVLLRLTVNSNVTSNYAPLATNFDLEAIIARSFTAVDSGGTAITAGALHKARTTMGNSLVNDIRVSTTAKLTAGTRTLDTYGFGFANVQMLGAVATNVGSCSIPIDLYRAESMEYPITLSANEGFIVRTPIAGNTSGGVRHTFTIAWAEVPAGSAF